MPQTRVPCLLMRGGSKKGAFFLASDLPEQPQARDRVLLAVMGSPDVRQIDGIGGGTRDTSKVVIVRPSRHPGADVDYLSGQVHLSEPDVDYSRSCGNLLAAVGPFAIERGLVSVAGSSTQVRVFMEATGQLATIDVPTPDGAATYAGDAVIDEVPGHGAPLIVQFQDIAGSSCGALLPTGAVVDVIDGVEVTCIDNGMPMVLIRAQDLGCSGEETPSHLDGDAELRARLEAIRLQAGPRMKLGDVRDRNVPKMCLISAAGAVGAISTRTFMPHWCHAGIGVFAALTVAAACVVSDSVAQRMAPAGKGDVVQVSVKHPSGEFTVRIKLHQGLPVSCGLMRTARLLFEGEVGIP